MKRIIISILTLCMTSSFIFIPQNVYATDFEGQEDKYIKICSSTTLAKSKKQTCKEFNTYLKKKNSELKKEISSSKSDIEDTKDDITEVENQIATLKTKIAAKEKEINYLLSSITALENSIKKKEDDLKNKLYLMQADYNSNYFIQFLFGAENFSDFFSRVTSLNDITAYEKDLVEQLVEQKNELDKQKKTLEQARANLQSEKENATALQTKLTALKKQQESELAALQKQSKELTAAQKEVNETLEEMMKSLPQSDSGGVAIKGTSGNAEVGYKVAQAALSKLGSRYYWGATGPTYFDCSGLVYWALNQAGVSGGRGTANSYAYSGTAISKSELQAGDVVCFKRSGASNYHHIAIYIGNGIVVHASGYGSSTLGQDPNQCVKRTPLSSFSKYGQAYRRLY